MCIRDSGDVERAGTRLEVISTQEEGGHLSSNEVVKLHPSQIVQLVSVALEVRWKPGALL